jgi:hypothetical protein
MPNQTIIMSSSGVPGTSPPANLSFRGGKPASVSVFVSTTTTSLSAVNLQFTLQDLQLVGGASNAFWQGVSSVAGQAATVFNSSVFGPDGLLYSFLSPVMAVRLNVTALTSGPITMVTAMGEGW